MATSASWVVVRTAQVQRSRCMGHPRAVASVASRCCRHLRTSAALSPSEAPPAASHTFSFSSRVGVRTSSVQAARTYPPTPHQRSWQRLLPPLQLQRRGLAGGATQHQEAPSVVTASSGAPSLDETVIVTKSCAARINELRNKRGGDAPLRLRLSVEGGGCSGFQYTFTMDNGSSAGGDGDDDGEEQQQDIVFERDGAQVVVDETSLEFVRGATIDFQADMMRSAFSVINNPNSENACGCGSSFAVKAFSANPARD